MKMLVSLQEHLPYLLVGEALMPHVGGMNSAPPIDASTSTSSAAKFKLPE